MAGSEHTGFFWIIERTPYATAALAITVGILVLFGWVFDLPLLKSGYDGLVAMKVNAALGFILAGISLWSNTLPVQQPLSRIMSQLCAISVLVLALLTAGEYLSGWSFGIDELLIKDTEASPGEFPGRMAPNTAANFAVLGTALLLLNQKKRGFVLTVHVLAIGIILVAATAVVCYAYDINAFLSSRLHYQPMAINTALVFVVLGFGILTARPDYPLQRIMMNDRAAGGTARRLWPAAIGLQLVMGWLLLKSIQAGTLIEAVALTIFVAANVGGLSVLILWNAAALYQADVQRELGGQALRESEEKYRTLFDSIDEGFCIVEMMFDEHERPVDFRFLTVNPAFERQTGISNPVGRRIREIAPLHEEYWFETVGKIAMTGEATRFENRAEQFHREYDGYAFRLGAPEDRKVAILFSDITERKQAEENLRNASLYARSLIEANLDPLVTISTDGKITDVNQATEDVTGLRREQLIGSDFSEYFTEPDKARKVYQTVFAQGFVKDYPLAIRHSSGCITDVLYNATLYRNEKGEFVGVFAAARDITERKQAEENLRNASLYARSLIEASLDPLVTISADGKITDVNQATEDVTGLRREQLIGSDFSEYFTEPDQARKGYQTVFAQGFVKDYPLAIRHSSGRITDVLYNARLYRNAKGEVSGVFAAARDITELKQNEIALQESEEKFRTISNSAQDAILMMDNDGAITYWNPAAEAIFGYPAELVMGRNLHTFLAPERYLEDYLKGFAHFRTTGEGPTIGRTLELMAKRNTGEEFPIELSLSAIKLNKRWSAVGIVRDITKRKQIEEQLRQAHDQLELRIQERTQELAKANQALQEDIEARAHAEEELRKLNETLAQRISAEVAKNREKDLMMSQQSRMAAMGEMIGNIAHQWRQPLNALAIMLSDIKEANEFGELNYEYLEEAIANGQRFIKKMSTTINDFRDFFRPDKERTSFSALAQISEAISLVEASFKNNDITLELIAPSDLRLMGFPNEYSQVLLNLFSNAKEAIQARNIAAGKVVVGLERVNGFGRVSVVDNGGGIPADILAKIFDPYFSTKETGTGIGLYMSKMIIERNMAGRIFARNTEGGAEFVIDTPLADEARSP